MSEHVAGCSTFWNPVRRCAQSSFLRGVQPWRECEEPTYIFRAAARVRRDRASDDPMVRGWVWRRRRREDGRMRRWIHGLGMPSHSFFSATLPLDLPGSTFIRGLKKFSAEFRAQPALRTRTLAARQTSHVKIKADLTGILPLDKLQEF